VFNALDFGDLIPATIKVSFLALPGLVGCFSLKELPLVGYNSAVVYLITALY
jgi:hypothetical protein